jgi:hypothetical protein
VPYCVVLVYGVRKGAHISYSRDGKSQLSELSQAVTFCVASPRRHRGDVGRLFIPCSPTPRGAGRDVRGAQTPGVAVPDKLSEARVQRRPQRSTPRTVFHGGNGEDGCI